MKRILFVGAILLVLSGCVTAPQLKYEWGNYEQSLYNYYKNPNAPDDLILAIASTIKTAEATNRSVGPGLYAEYGYLLMMQGKQQDAIANFEKEKIRWPESAQLMDKMTKLAQTQPAAKGDVKQ
jgi:hypothetical protein